mmetsp:Transcript_52917/g.102114  ORF Transcript_52917/g.102114 Transcript_52917/m.102114 type:complete len:82 (-) Transcript_52917:939-1184(-)
MEAKATRQGEEKDVEGLVLGEVAREPYHTLQWVKLALLSLALPLEFKLNMHDVMRRTLREFSSFSLRRLAGWTRIAILKAF